MEYKSSRVKLDKCVPSFRRDQFWFPRCYSCLTSLTASDDPKNSGWVECIPGIPMITKEGRYESILPLLSKKVVEKVKFGLKTSAVGSDLESRTLH